MDGTGKCKLPSTPPSTGLSRIQHLNTNNGEILNLETSADLFIRKLQLNTIYRWIEFLKMQKSEISVIQILHRWLHGICEYVNVRQILKYFIDWLWSTRSFNIQSAVLDVAKSWMVKMSDKSHFEILHRWIDSSWFSENGSVLCFLKRKTKIN
jgi:hypothetical protein